MRFAFDSAVDHDLYKLLGVDPTASEAEIRRAYRRAARQWHPDANDSPSAPERMALINRAHDVLTDSTARAEYDRMRTRRNTGAPATAATGDQPKSSRPQASTPPPPPLQGDTFRGLRVTASVLVVLMAVLAYRSIRGSVDQSSSKPSRSPAAPDTAQGAPVGTVATAEPPTVQTTIAPTTIAPTTIAPTGWPTSANDGPPALYALMGANLTINSWVSCAGNYCIGGREDQIDVYRLQPLDYLGFVSATARSSPEGVLEQVGFEPEQISGLLKR